MENGLANQSSKDKTEKTSEERKPLKLSSPGGGSPILYPFQSEINHLHALDILDLIRSVLPDYPQIETVISNYCKLEEVDVHSYSAIRSLCKKFNKAIHQMLKSGKPDPTPMSRELLRHVVTRCYNKAVDNEKALNKHYEAFSSQTYGETSYDRMQMILDEIQPTTDDVFVDLGSGVGQLVVHVAGSNKVKKAMGIEIAQLPSRFAKVLEQEFKRHVEWYGKLCGYFELQQGDFLDMKYRELITQEATIIFINNYAFQSDLETRIKMELLHELKDGTRIITTKPYVSLNKNSAITDRQMNDISVIIDITELKQCPNPCSWTSNYVPYYMHVINRAKLERYFLSRNPALRGRSNDGSRRSSTPSSKNSNSRESSVGLKESKNSHKHNGNSEDVGFGPTTRRRWQEYVSELDQQKHKKKFGNSEDGVMSKTSSSGTISQSHLTDVFSDGKGDDDSEGSIPAKKRQRRISDKKKDKSFRGRPRKPDGGHKNSSMSADAKEGIELMHQMTKAVSYGGKADASSILADLTNQNAKEDVSMSESSVKITSKSPSSTSASFPLPSLITSGQSGLHVTAETSLDILRSWRSEIRKTSENNEISSSKYPSLNKFLVELRYLYENFLDSMQIPEFVQTLSNKIKADKARKSVETTSVRAVDSTPIKQEVADIGKTAAAFPEKGDEVQPPTFRSHFADRMNKLVSMHKDILTKSKDLNDCIVAYNAELEKLAAEVSRSDEQLSVSEPVALAQSASVETLCNNKNVENCSQERDLISEIARQQLIQQHQQQQQIQEQKHQAFPQSTTNPLFSAASGSGIEQLMISDLAHNYSQQQRQLSQRPPSVANNALLLSQLTQILSTTPRLQNVAQGPSPALISPICTENPALQNLFNNTRPTSTSSEIQCQTQASPTITPNMLMTNRSEFSPAVNSFSQVRPNLLNMSQTQFPTTQQLLDLFSRIPANVPRPSGFNASTESQTNRLEITNDDVVMSNENFLNQQQTSEYGRKLTDMIISNATLLPSFVQSSTQQSLQRVQPQPMSNVSIDSDMAMASTSGANVDSNQSTVAVVVAAVAAGNTKKIRPKPNRPTQCTKRASKQMVEDPEKEEEMKRQIQDIVDKALLVDHVAKQSEKERKARSFEKRREKCSASLSIATPNFAGTSASVSANYSATKKRNSSDMYSSGSNNFELLSPISTNAANSSFGGSACNSAISSPVAHNFSSSAASACAQLLSTANNNNILPLKQPISIVSVAPPPHSPLVGGSTIDVSADIAYSHHENTNGVSDVLTTTTMDARLTEEPMNGQINNVSSCLTIDISDNALYKRQGYSESSIVCNRMSVDEEIRNSNITAQANNAIASTSITLWDVDGQKSSKSAMSSSSIATVSPHTTQYVPLSKRTVIENLNYSLPQSSETPGAPSPRLSN